MVEQPHAPAFSDQFVSNGGVLHSFSEARALVLKTDADYARFVDSSVQGADRAEAISLLKLMPPGMRGDFVRIEPDGRVISNRTGFAGLVAFHRGEDQSGAPEPPAGSRRPMYPPVTSQGGPTLRFYSQQGINAAYGYATPPCDVQLGPGESGNMYFNSYDPYGSGSDTDGGIGANETSRYPVSSVVAFVNDRQHGWDPGTWVNQSQGWACGTTLGMMYGSLPSPNQNTSVLVVGVPDFDPKQMSLPPASANWYTSSWTFFPTNTNLLTGGGSWNGIPSNCMGCAVGRMFTIGQSQLDGACYGACDLTPDGRWDEVVMGELINPCQQNSSTQMTCTIQFMSSGNWEGGEYDTGPGIFFDDPNQQQGLEGIVDATNGAQSLRSYAPNSALRQNLPPAPAAPCTPDAMGYCAIASPVASCHTKLVGPKSDPTWIVVSIPGQYQIFKKVNSLELQGTYTKTFNSDDTACYSTYSWSPADPASVYHDSSLP